MTTEADVRALTQKYVEPWPPDDTEESILGTNLHQTTITNLRLGINEAAHLYQEGDQPLPWEASSQILILGWRRPDGSAYRTFPDVFVYPHPIGPNRASMSVAIDGPPVLIIEVLSESTYEVDLDVEAGKGYSYAQARVHEYLTLDPMGLVVPEGGRAWRLVGSSYQPWERDGLGRWRSQEIPISIEMEGTMATVYTHEGQRLLREDEAAQMQKRLAQQAAEIEDLRRQLREGRSTD